MNYINVRAYIFFLKLSLGLLTATTKKDTENINNKSKKSSNRRHQARLFRGERD